MNLMNRSTQHSDACQHSVCEYTQGHKRHWYYFLHYRSAFDQDTYIGRCYLCKELVTVPKPFACNYLLSRFFAPWILMGIFWPVYCSRPMQPGYHPTVVPMFAAGDFFLSAVFLCLGIVVGCFIVPRFIMALTLTCSPWQIIDMKGNREEVEKKQKEQVDLLKSRGRAGFVLSFNFLLVLMMAVLYVT